MNRLKITSDGTAAGTRVFSGSAEIKDITRIEFLPIAFGGVVSAVLHFDVVELDLVAELAPEKPAP